MSGSTGPSHAAPRGTANPIMVTRLVRSAGLAAECGRFAKECSRLGLKVSMAGAGDMAVLSDCERYRYLLTRELNGYRPRTLSAIMLNPSTADASKDDPTIRKLKGFADRWGCGRLVVANLMAWRATSPRELFKAEDARGTHNDMFLWFATIQADVLLYAWGANKAADKLASWSQTSLILAGADVPAQPVCLGRTKSGAPEHPLYVPYLRERQLYLPHPTDAPKQDDGAEFSAALGLLEAITGDPCECDHACSCLGALETRIKRFVERHRSYDPTPGASPQSANILAKK